MVPYLIDTTLRDGEQAPGVAFSIDEKISVAALLNELHIDEVEIGTPAISKNEQESIRIIASAGFSFKTSSWCRAVISDLKVAAKLGTSSVNISLPVSDMQIETLGKSKEWVISELKKVMSFAKQNFAFVTMGAQDASRADRTFLKEFLFFANDYGANRIRINDTVGVLDPLSTKELINDVVWSFPEVEFEFHGHNDFGMATANAITAWQSGVKCISATVNGLGERAGNAVIEELVAYARYKQLQNKYDTTILNKLSSYVSEISGRALSASKPITGKSTYLHESGVHTSAMLSNKLAYQVLEPKDYGVRDTEFTFGKHSGSAALFHYFKQKGVELDSWQLGCLRNELERKALLSPKILKGDDLFKMYADISYKRRVR